MCHKNLIPTQQDRQDAQGTSKPTLYFTIRRQIGDKVADAYLRAYYRANPQLEVTHASGQSADTSD